MTAENLSYGRVVSGTTGGGFAADSLDVRPRKEVTAPPRPSQKDGAAHRADTSRTASPAVVKAAPVTRRPSAALHGPETGVAVPPATAVRSILAADSLHDGAADSLIYIGRDSLPSAAADSLVVAADTLFREVEAPVIFGNRSLVVGEQLPVTLRTPSLVGQPLFQGFVLMVAFSFALVINKFLPDVKALLGGIFTHHTSGERLSPGSNNNNLMRLLDASAWVGALMTGAAVVRFFGEWVPQEVGALLDGGAALAVTLAVPIVLVGVHLFQYVTLRATGEVLLCRDFISQLWQLKRICFSLFVIFCTPPLLLYMFVPSGSGRWLLVVMAFMLSTALFVYVKETISLFLSKKISILHWFLYLCTVELFPVSLLWLLALKKL